MIPSQDTFQNISLAFISVFFSCVFFANTGVNGFFIKKGKQVIGLEQVFLSPSITEKQGVFYLVEKTISNADTFSISKVVYLSKEKELAKNEKVISSLREGKNLSIQINTTINKGTPFNKFPTTGAFLRFHYQYCIFAWGSTQAGKNALSFLNKSIYIKNSAGNTLSSEPFKRQLNCANTKKNNRILFLSSYHCRPLSVA